jgi:dolichyl-phosphate-mannose--protein O-mannosyl transferase
MRMIEAILTSVFVIIAYFIGYAVGCNNIKGSEGK